MEAVWGSVLLFMYLEELSITPCKTQNQELGH